MKLINYKENELINEKNNIIKKYNYRYLKSKYSILLYKF